ncbi:MAG: class I SAM-dependent methyltransferase [Pseudomonadales bacterium]|nr:class I SAM-dependent methyltransferase [Pseudomonadales bacterium]
MKQIIKAIRDTIFSSPDDSQRIFHGRGQCYAGLEYITVDWFKPVIWVCLYRRPDTSWLEAFKAEITALMLEAGDGIVLLQHRYQPQAPCETLFGPYVDSGSAFEDQLCYQLRFGSQQNVGLFLDMAEGRYWVRRHASNAKVLNLFAYTCAFSVVAIAGGADLVVNVDMSKAALAWGRENHRINQQPLDKVKFFGHDVMRSWGKLKKHGPYDLVIADPPSFQKGSFVAEKDYPKMARRFPELLNENGMLLACLNAPELSADFLIETMAGVGLSLVGRLKNPETFPEKYLDRGLKVLLFEQALFEGE